MATHDTRATAAHNALKRTQGLRDDPLSPLFPSPPLQQKLFGSYPLGRGSLKKKKKEEEEKRSLTPTT